MRRLRNHDPPTASGSVVGSAVGIPLGRHHHHRSPHHHQRPSLPASPLVTNSRKKSTPGYGSSVETSIVFLRKKTTQAIQIQALIRGFIARRYYQRKMARHQKRIAKRQKKQRWNTAATRIQKHARRFVVQHCRKITLPHMRQQRQAATILQAMVRGFVKRRYYNSEIGKLELRLLQIQREEQKELDSIEQSKLAKRTELDRTRKELRHEQAERAVHQVKLEEEYYRQQAIMEQLKKDNKKMRSKIDRYEQEEKEMKTKRKSLHMLEETTDNFQTKLQDKIKELETSIEHTAKVETKCAGTAKRWQQKLDRVVDLLGSEKRQQYVYVKCMDRLLTKLEHKQWQQRVNPTTEATKSTSTRRSRKSTTNYEQLLEDCLAIAAGDK